MLSVITSPGISCGKSIPLLFLNVYFLFYFYVVFCGGAFPPSPRRRIPTPWSGPHHDLVGCGVLAMSLTSRVFGLFTTTGTSDSDSASSASSSSSSAPNVGSVSNNGFTASSTSIIDSSQATTMPEEDEPRPPYLNVCAYVPFAVP